jgi:hypothetical protein
MTRRNVSPPLPAGLSKPALRALASAGYERLDQLTEARDEELLALHGLGPKGLRILREALAQHAMTKKAT